MAGKGSYSLWGDNETYSTEFRAPSGDIYQQRNDERTQDSMAEVDNVEVERGQWGSKAEFILSCVGLSVGLGNVWRFPYLAYENGGAAFLIAYLILQLLIGKPMYFMELAIGQFSAKGPTGVWHMNPSAKGIGIAMAVISLIVAIFYNVIMAYTLYYFFASMQSTLPWTVCKESWENCVSTRVKSPELCTGNASYDESLDGCRCTGNSSIDSILTVNCTNITGKPTTASEYYFYKEVIQQSSGLEPSNLGLPSWQLLLCLVLSWIIVVACLIKGVKSSGKVVYFTATFPYLILLILLVRGCLLDGAVDGILYFIVPKWEKLLDPRVWSAAAGQMFFSLSVSFGGIIMFGSYNKFKNNVYADALFISIMDLVTSIIAGFVIFTTFGGMAKKAGTTVAEVAKAGYGLAFVAYPEALSNFPIPQLWSVIFFFMLFTLGLDSEFGMMETVLTCICDEFPKMRKYRGRLCIALGVLCFLLALPCICPGGNYVVNIMGDYGGDFSVLVVASCECIAIMWVYGVRRFLSDVEYMIGHKPALWPYWVFCWAVISPIGIAVMFVYRMVQYKPLYYPNGDAYPVYAQAIAWVLCCAVLSPIPVTAVYMYSKAKGTFRERLRFITTPTAFWQPQGGTDLNALTSDHFQMNNKYGLTNPAMDSYKTTL